MTPNRTDPTAAKRTDPTAVDGSDLLALVQLALDEARALGATQTEAAVSMDVGLSVSVRLGEVETIEYQRDRGMGVTVYFGTRKVRPARRICACNCARRSCQACSIARFTAEDDCAGLADPNIATEIPDLDLAHVWDLAPEERSTSRSRAKRPRSASIHGSRTPKVRPLARIVVCAPTAIRTLSRAYPARFTA